MKSASPPYRSAQLLTTISDMSVMRLFRATLVAVTLVTLTTACANGEKKASLGGFESTAEAPASSTTSTPLSMASLVLSADGIGSVSFGTQAARALGALTQALGRAESSTVVPEGATCEATRIFRWKDLDVIVNEVGGRSGGRAGLVGWSVGVPAPSSLGLKTEKGLGTGQTVSAFKAAYGESVSITHGDSAPILTITASNGVLTGEADGLSDASKIKTFRAGVSCAVR